MSNDLAKLLSSPLPPRRHALVMSARVIEGRILPLWNNGQSTYLPSGNVTEPIKDKDKDRVITQRKGQAFATRDVCGSVLMNFNRWADWRIRARE